MIKSEVLTLMIPTYNRSRYLKRLLSYYNNHNMNCEILILDSSHEKFKKANRETISSFPDLKLNHLDHFSSETNFYTKIALSKDYFNRKFTIMCADDDFIVPKALDRCIEFLENNSDYTAVGGYHLSFLTKTDRKRKIFFWQKYLSSFKHLEGNMSVTSNDPKTRLNKHFSSFFPSLYYLHSTDFLKRIFEETLPSSQDYDFAFSFGELLLDMLTVIYGKIKTLDIFYGARESVHTPQPAIFKSLNDLVKEGSYDFHYKKFKDCLTKHLTQEANINLQTAEKFVDEGMDLYIQNHIGNLASHSGIKKIISSSLRTFNFFRINLAQYQKLSFKTQIDLRNWEKSNPISKYYEDFIDIQKCILDND